MNGLYPMQSQPMQLQSDSRLQKIPILFDELGLNALPDAQQALISQIDACLPQTQCGLCEHPEGCLPYAHSIVVKGEATNKCVPGGQPVTDKISDLVSQAISQANSQINLYSLQVKQSNKQSNKLSAVASKWDINPTTKRPQEVRAVIREADCIGCTKCIPACPVDAIIGTGKHMHTIITDLCTGCELCLSPCPVDCIDLEPIQRVLSDTERQQEQDHLRKRYYTHLNRVTMQMQDKRNAKPVVSVVQSKLTSTANASLDIDESQAKNAIASAKLRTKIKKLEKQLAVRDNEKKRLELETLKSELQTLA